jgi:hypothetical protein
VIFASADVASFLSASTNHCVYAGSAQRCRRFNVTNLTDILYHGLYGNHPRFYDAQVTLVPEFFLCSSPYQTFDDDNGTTSHLLGRDALLSFYRHLFRNYTGL